MELSHYTTAELIKEISNRTTFAGVIFKAATEAKNFPFKFEKWDITYSNLNEIEVKSLLESAVEHFEQLTRE